MCLGNICRSPTAEGIFRALLEEAGLGAVVGVDSAGTGAWHVGEPPDPRSRATARRRGVELRGRGRQFQRDDFRRFDYVVAMDGSNLRELARLAPDADARDRLHRLRDFDPASAPGSDVPDPYYEDGFDGVFDICEAACRGLLAHVRERHGL